MSSIATADPAETSNARATSGLRFISPQQASTRKQIRAQRGAVRDRPPSSFGLRGRSYGVLTGPKAHPQLVSLPPITEPQLKALKHFGGEAQFTWTVSATGERVGRQWYPNERIVRALVEKELLTGSCAAGGHRANRPPGCRHQLSVLAKAMVDCERGYAIIDDGPGGTAVCLSDAAFRRAQGDKVRSPWLQFERVRWDDPDGACVRQAFWVPKAPGEHRWAEQR